MRRTLGRTGLKVPTHAPLHSSKKLGIWTSQGQEKPSLLRPTQGPGPANTLLAVSRDCAPKPSGNLCLNPTPYLQRCHGDPKHHFKGLGKNCDSVLGSVPIPSTPVGSSLDSLT